MKILVNRKIRLLFCWVILFIIVFALLSVVFMVLNLKNVVLYVFISSLCMGIFTLAAMLLYFKEQNKIMENAIIQVKEYISGNQNARIECDDEGELYRLFHEVNSLVCILNAHAENEEKGKKTMKDAISDISHQLKTPLAALNIYNGIMQEEANDLPIIKEFTDLSEQELDRIETLVQNLLKIAKLDTGTIIIEKTFENVSEMMCCIERQFAYRAKQEEKIL